jgi:hypothetical protein
MRRAVTPAIPPSMYRHFAVVTLVLTLGLAMFADGENREAREVLVQSSRPKPVPQSHFHAPTAHELDANARAFAREMSADFDSDFGRPMHRAVSRFRSGVIPDLTGISVPGYSQEYLASLTEDERRLLLQGLQDNGMLSPEIRAEQSAAILADSSRRSGRATQAE